jgi:IS5 family transposase
MKRKAHFQATLAAQTSFEKYGRKSRREEFLNTMDVVVPWRELEALIEPHYPKAGNGRQPVGLSIMLRVYFLQQWFNLSDPGAEDALYESPVLRRFAGVDLGRAAAPDETTVLRFRRLLEQYELCGKILDTVSHDHCCSIVDQEQQGRARSGDAPDAERQPMVFRRQGAHRRR